MISIHYISYLGIKHNACLWLPTAGLFPFVAAWRNSGVVLGFLENGTSVGRLNTLELYSVGHGVRLCWMQRFTMDLGQS